MNRVLVQFAHPAIHKSRVNRRLASVAREVQGVTFNDLYETYPDFLIDVEREKQLLLEHDVYVFQHPFYWYSTPSILKEWIDLVLEYGFAYGEGGDKLQGKAWAHAFSTGGPESAYSSTGYNRFTIAQLLAPLEQTAHLCGIHFLKPLVLFRTPHLETEPGLVEACADYRKFLETLRDHKAPWESLK